MFINGGGTMRIIENWSEFVFQFSVGAVGGIVAQLYGGWSNSLKALLIFVAIDYVSGFFAARKEGKLSSQVGMMGIAKKVMVFPLIAVAHLIDHWGISTCSATERCFFIW
jgi:phage-related holin